MNKKFLVAIIFSLLTFFVFLQPSSALAFKIYFDNSVSSVNVGETTFVKVFLDTEGKEINSLEGFLIINGKTDISEINTGGSVFNLWPEKPNLLNNEEISFTGGTEGGIYGKNLRLFNFVLTPTLTGEISLQTKDIFAYLNDGKGTKQMGINTNFKIKVIEQNKKETPQIIEKDKISPASFKIEIGHDEFLFNGKYFITFNTTDSVSGINKYQVKEGSMPYVDSDNSYVLKDQSLKSKIFVKAIDNKGNERIETFKLKQDLSLFEFLRATLIAVILFTFVNIFVIFFKGKK